MKKATITVNFDEEKTAALKLYLEKGRTRKRVVGSGKNLKLLQLVSAICNLCQ